MIPIPRILYESYVTLWGEMTTALFFHPAPLGLFL